jgi:hypothetical protein
MQKTNSGAALTLFNGGVFRRQTLSNAPLRAESEARLAKGEQVEDHKTQRAAGLEEKAPASRAIAEAAYAQEAPRC